MNEMDLVLGQPLNSTTILIIDAESHIGTRFRCRIVSRVYTLRFGLFCIVFDGLGVTQAISYDGSMSSNIDGHIFNSSVGNLVFNG